MYFSAMLNGKKITGDYRGNDFRRAKMRKASLAFSDFRDCDFRFADLRESCLYGTDLRGANLDKANLDGVDFRFAKGDGKRIINICDDILWCDGVLALGILIMDIDEWCRLYGEDYKYGDFKLEDIRYGI